MATKRILRLTNTEAIVKVDGPVGAVTVDLATDLKLTTEDITTPSVNIVAMAVTGRPGAYATITRNGVELWDLQADAGVNLNLLDIGGITDSINNTSDIVVTTSGAECQLLLKLRKISGYQTKIRITETGSDTPV